MNAKQKRLYDSVLAQIARHGWTPQAIKVGAGDAGLTPAAAQKLFPRGMADIVDAFHADIDAAMRKSIAAHRKFAAMRVRDKVAFAVRARLEFLAHHRAIVRGLLLWAIMPRHIRSSGALLWQAADAIWIAAGDTSTDYNFYTKRVLLIAVMKSTLSFWLNDTSHDSRDTWAFLDRRIDDVLKIGKGIGMVKAVGLSDIASFIRGRFAA